MSDNQRVQDLNISYMQKALHTLISIVTGFLLTSIANAAILEEVVVTAQKRNESAQDVPISITALGEEDIGRYGVNDVYDLRGAVPGLEVRRATAFGNPTFTIRGVGATNFDTISGSVVATYIDDMPQVSSGQLNFTSFDLANIEVLKGPQGTLFGSGTTAGVVHLKSNRPTQEFEAYVKAGAGDYGSYDVEGAVSGPLTDSVSGRLSIRGELFDGYYTNTATNDDAGGLEAYQMRGQLLWKTDEASILVNARYATADSEAILYHLVPLLADDGTGTAITCPVVAAANARGKFTEADVRLANVQCVDIFGESNTGNGIDDPYVSNAVNLYDTDSEVGLDTFGFSVRADIDVGGTRFTSITGVDRSTHGGVDPEGPLFRAGVFDVFWVTDVLLFNQEFQLASGDDSEHTWIVGANIVAHEIENELLSQLSGTGFGSEGFPILNLTPVQTAANSLNYFAPQDQDTLELGIFGQVDWHLTDALTAITGVRGSWYKKEGSVEAFGTFTTGTPSNFDPVNTTLEEGSISFNLGLNYVVNDDLLVYGKISQGVRSGSHAGGFIFSPDSAPGAKQETLLSYEIGLKSVWLDGTLQLNGAAFYYDYEDLQSLTQRLVGSSFVQRYTNIGDAEVKGAELDITWAATDSLFFKVATTFLDTEVTKNGTALAIDFTGNELANSPDVAASWLVRYTVPFMNGYELSLQYDGNFTDDQFRNVDNSTLDFDEATLKHNAIATLTSPDGTWDVSAWGKNLSDELDFTWQFSFGGAQRRSYLAPRTWGLSGTYRW